MLITDSYLGNRFNGQHIAADAYDDFLKKKRAGASRPAGAPPTKRQQKKTVKAQKKELKKQGLAPKKPGLFGKKKAAATGINSPAAKKTGLFGIKQKPNPMLATMKKADAPELEPKALDMPEPANEMAEPAMPMPESQAEALADGASNDLGEISDKTPAAEPEATADNDNGGAAEPVTQTGTEEQEYYAFDLEQWPTRRRRMTAYDSFDEPKETDKKTTGKKKGISLGAVLGLLGAAAAGALAMYVVISAGEKGGQQELKLTRNY